MAKALGMTRGLCHLHDGLIGSPYHPILLWRARWQGLSCNAVFAQKIIKRLWNKFPTIVRPKNLHYLLWLPLHHGFPFFKATPCFFTLSIYTKILCEKLSMNVRKYLMPPMNIVVISMCMSECMSSKIFMTRVPLLVKNGLLTCLARLSRGFLKLQLFELQLATSLWPWQANLPYEKSLLTLRDAQSSTRSIVWEWYPLSSPHEVIHITNCSFLSSIFVCNFRRAFSFHM